MTNHVQPRIRNGKQAGLVGIAILMLAGFCVGQPVISLSRASGPPTTQLRVSGSGFAPYAKIDLYFGTKDEAVAIANGVGSFSQIAIAAPASALPGTHWVSAVERSGHTGAQATFLVWTNWNQFHRDNMQRRNPYENVLNVNNVGGLQLKWSHPIGRTDGSPMVANGLVYIRTDGGLFYALKASNGHLRWKYKTAKGACCTGPSPAIANGVVYIGSLDGLVYALNASTGAKLWSYQTGADVESSPTVVNGVVYVGSDDGNVYALNASTGALLWSYQTGNTAGWSSPAVANGVVYIGSSDNNVYALNVGAGTLLWSHATGSSVGSSSPAVANNVVYVGSQDSNVYALNAGTGTLLWSYGIGGGQYNGSSPALANGVVYIGSGLGANTVYALKASTGALLWSLDTGNNVGGSPAVANGVVYVGNYSGTMYGFEARTGATLWSYQMPSGTYAISSSPAVVNGVVYVGSTDGNLYAFGLKHGQEKTEGNSKRPGLKVLRPDLNLKVSQPTARAANGD